MSESSIFRSGGQTSEYGPRPRISVPKPMSNVLIDTFFVPGRPAPQGSKRHIGHGRMLESSQHLGPWRERVAIAAHNAMRGRNLLIGPIQLTLRFVLPRPKQTPKTTPPAVKRPDIDKLARACLDALTNTLYTDDAQVTTLNATKRIAEPGENTGVHITICETT